MTGSTGQASRNLEGQAPQLRRLIAGVTNVVAVSAVVSTLLFVGRALEVAKFQTDTADALIINTPLATAIQSMALTMFPATSYVLGLAAVYGAVTVFRGAVRKKGPFDSFIALLAIALFSIGLALEFPFIATNRGWALGSLVYLIPTLSIAAAARAERVTFLASPLVAIPIYSAVLLGLTQLSVPSIWLPPERVTIEGKPYVVYVLSDDSQRLVVYAPDNNVVIRLSPAVAKDRQYCMQRDQGTTAADVLLGRPTGLPSCPEPASLPMSVIERVGGD